MLKKNIPDNWNLSNKKRACPYEYFISMDDYQKLVDNLKKEDFCSKVKNACLDDKGVERTEQSINFFDSENGEELEKLHTNTDIILLAEVFENLGKKSNEEYGTNPLYCVSICSYILQCGLKYTDIKYKPQKIRI